MAGRSSQGKEDPHSSEPQDDNLYERQLVATATSGHNCRDNLLGGISEPPPEDRDHRPGRGKKAVFDPAQQARAAGQQNESGESHDGVPH